MAKNRSKSKKGIKVDKTSVNEQGGGDDYPVHMMYAGVITGVLANYYVGKIANVPEIFISGVQGAALVMPHALFRHAWHGMGIAQKYQEFSILGLVYITSVGAVIGWATAVFLNADALEGEPDFGKAILGAKIGGFLAACNYLLQFDKPQCEILGCIGLGLLGYELFGLNGIILAVLNIAAENRMREKLFATSAISIGCICTDNAIGGVVGLGVAIGYNLFANNVYNEGYAINR